MSVYNIDQSKSTSMGAMDFLRYGALATALIVSPAQALAMNNGSASSSWGFLTEAYTMAKSQSTASSANTEIHEGADFSDLAFERAVSQFYAGLLSEQEPLGTEFAEVLSDGLWDLYIQA